MADENMFDNLHQQHKQDVPAGLENCAECRADTIRMILRRLADGDNKFDSLRNEIAANTRITVENSSTLQDVKEIVEMGRAMFKFFGWVGRFAKWVGGIAGAILGIVGLKEVIEKLMKG